MNSAIISGLIGGVLIAILNVYTSKKLRKSKVKGELKFGAFIASSSFLSMALTGVLIAAFFYNADVWDNPIEFLAITCLIIKFSVIAIYCFVEYFKVHGKFDEIGIHFTTPWTGRKMETWCQLESVKLNSHANWYTLKFKSGSVIRLSCFLTGHGDVIDLLNSKGYFE
ncbi:hypothetical protein [Parashewanella tropica]|uniref:hypothetical protein n=1 Tax=Parashewanella tropica TaxID=2547970 RepID=UPI001059A14C|nr:hypothetical protein [Parashewanella tropica]